MIRRMRGVLLRPRRTMAALVARPVWADTWFIVLAGLGFSAAMFLSTDVGEQALVDERVRVIEAFGGTVDDERYAAIQTSPPRWIYLTSGGRLLLSPPVTLLVAAACWGVARAEGLRPTFRQTLAVAVHASVVLLVGQLIVAPLTYVGESLSNPLNLAALLPGLQEGTWAARFFGAVDVFGLWWLWVLAVGLSALTGGRRRRYLAGVVCSYAAIAAALAGLQAIRGG